jgi:hypothetical protein
MHLSYNVCILLLSAFKHKQLNLSTFKLCCVSFDMRANGSNPGHSLSHLLQQRLTRWGPLRDCENAIDTISCVESLGLGSLVELASLHGICLDARASEKDRHCDAIVNHLVLGECQNTNAMLCASIRSVLLLAHEPNNLRPLILDAVIKLGTKKTLRRALSCVEITYNLADNVNGLRSLLSQYRDMLFVGGMPHMQRNEHPSAALRDVADNWPQRTSHSDKARIVHSFRTTMSSSELKTVTCASCAERVRANNVSKRLVSDLDLNVLRSPLFDSSNQTDAVPPLPYTEGPLAGILVDPIGVHLDGAGALYLSLCPPCKHALLRKKLPRFALANLNVIGAVPPELQSLTLVEELIISRCRAKLYIVKLQDCKDDVDLPVVQRGMKGHIIVFPQHPEHLPNVMPPTISDIISPYACFSADQLSQPHSG